MSFTDFSDIQYIKVFDTDETTAVGDTITFNESTEIKYCRAMMFLYSSFFFTGNERMRMFIYNDAGRQPLTDLVFVSEYLNLSEIDNVPIDGSGSWLGRVRFEFDSIVPFLAGVPYYASVEISGYTRNADNYYIGLALDYPIATNTIDPANPPIALEFYGVN